MTYESTSFQDAKIDVAAMLSALVKRLPRIIAVTLGLLALTFVFLMFQPRLYESSASILVEPRSNAYVRASNEQAPTITGGEAGVVSSQIELLKSRDTLMSVIDELDLRSNPEFNGSRGGFSPLSIVFQLFGRSSTPTSIDETVLNTLYDRLNVAQERDSRIISVAVQSVDPELAAKIANALANAHVARRVSLSISDTADASGWLREEIERLRVSVQQADSAVAEFKVSNDLFTGQNNTSLLDQQLSTIAAQITDSQGRKNAAETRAALIRGLIQRGQPIEGVANVRESVVIQQLSQEKARLQGEKAQRSSTLLANHPTILALTAQIAELDSQIRAEGRRVADALEAEAQIESDLEASLQADLARAKNTASTATRDTVTLEGLQREAKAQRDLLEAYLLRYNEASSRVETNSALPDVRVVSVAAPSVTPASPKVTLVMAGVGILSVILQVGVVIFGELMSGRAIVPIARRPLMAEGEYDPRFDDEVVVTDDDQHADYGTDNVGNGRQEQPVAEPVAYDPAPVHSVSPSRQNADMDAQRAFLRSLMQPAAQASVAEDLPVEEDAPVFAAVPPSPARRTRTRGLLRHADLVSDMVLGRTHLVLIADHGANGPGRHFAEDLVGDALAKGLSVALIDAGSGRHSNVPGITDLSAGLATFGDVVQKSADNTFAEILWGEGDGIDFNSPKPKVLAEALSDIYEVVVILTGRVGRNSALPLFADMDGRVIIVADENGDPESLEMVRQRLQGSGIGRVEIAALGDAVAA